MASAWSTRRILVTVRTYPVPAKKGIEVSCTAAVSEDGQWVRLFPVPYRLLPPDRQFEKYQWIEASLQRAPGDARPESYHPNVETIKLGEVVSTEHEWSARFSILAPLMRPSMCAIRAEQEQNGHPTLGLFRPAKIKRLLIRPSKPDWTDGQKTILRQQTFDGDTPKEELEKIPFDFSYEFACNDPACRGHEMLCTDWEMAQAYRAWRQKYGDKWESKFRERFERDMIEKYDTHFYVGTIHQHPKSWIIVGLFYPPKGTTKGLFE